MNTNFFEEFFDQPQTAIPADIERFHNRLDYYLRTAAEQMAKDFNLEGREWPLLDDFFIKRNGGITSGKLRNFRHYALNAHAKDTKLLQQLIDRRPEIFDRRAAVSIENTYRFLWHLWQEGINCLKP